MANRPPGRLQPVQLQGERAFLVCLNYHLGLYGGTQWGDLAFRTGGALIWHGLDTARAVAIPVIGESLTADYMASTQGTTRFEPFANLAHVDVRTGGYAEAGGNAALSGNGGDTDVNFTTLGLRAEHGFTLGVVDATFRGMRARTFSKSSRDNTSVRIISASNLNAFDNAASSLSRDLGR